VQHWLGGWGGRGGWFRGPLEVVLPEPTAPQSLVPVSGAELFPGRISAESPWARWPSACPTAGRLRWTCRAVARTGMTGRPSRLCHPS
jgi:hypothetical protein